MKSKTVKMYRVGSGFGDRYFYHPNHETVYSIARGPIPRPLVWTLGSVRLKDSPGSNYQTSLSKTWINRQYHTWQPVYVNLETGEISTTSDTDDEIDQQALTCPLPPKTKPPSRKFVILGEDDAFESWETFTVFNSLQAAKDTAEAMAVDYRARFMVLEVHGVCRASDVVWEDLK